MTEFQRRVLEYVASVPKGKVVTYRQIAVAIGNPGYTHAIGNALHSNPDGIKYPCYKVVNAQGMLAPAYVFGGREVQKAMLASEGIEVVDFKVDLERYQYRGK